MILGCMSSKFYYLPKEQSHLLNGWPVSEELSRAADAEFLTATGKLDVPVDKAFFVKVAGCSHHNADRTSRTKIIAHCDPLEPLQLEREPDNRFDSNAVKVLRGTGSQIGYLDAWTAKEVASDFERYGLRWLAVFRHANFSPETGQIVGAVIYLIRIGERAL
jgi:HIRAN domain